VPGELAVIDYHCADRVASLTLDQPQSGNALSIPMMRAFRSALEKAAKSPGVDMVALRATGRHFCSGADLQWIKSIVTGDEALWREGMQQLLGLLADLQGMDKPLLAAVHGSVIGAGVSLLCLCDVVVATDTMRWRLPEVALGMVPTAVMPALRYRLSPAVVRQLLLEPDQWSAAQAQSMGLVSEVTSAVELEAALQARLAKMRALPGTTLSQTKRLLRELDADGFAQDLQRLWPQALATLHDGQARERIAAIRG